MLKGKTALITGGAKGIGKAIALAFAGEGANIALNYRGDIPEDTIREIEKSGVSCIAYKADCSNYEQVGDMIKQVKEDFGRIDILVNNAGITRDNLLIRMKEEEFDACIHTNLKGAYNTIRHASLIMLKQKNGVIINIASVVGLVGNTGQANYAASKAGIIGMTKSVAKELGGKGIRVNAIAPGFIETEMTDVLPEQTKENALTQIPLKSLGKPSDVAQTAVFLAKSNYITGQVINVCGGMVM